MYCIKQCAYASKLGMGDMEKYNITIFFRNVAIHDFITILCQVGFTILQVVWAIVPN